MNATEQIASGFLLALGLYLAIGLLFALFLVFRALRKIDESAAGGTFGFKCCILPGVIALWPYLFWRWKKACGNPPLEQSPHRNISGCGNCGTCPKGSKL